MGKRRDGSVEYRGDAANSFVAAAMLASVKTQADADALLARTGGRMRDAIVEALKTHTFEGDEATS